MVLSIVCNIKAEFQVFFFHSYSGSAWTNVSVQYILHTWLIPVVAAATTVILACLPGAVPSSYLAAY